MDIDTLIGVADGAKALGVHPSLFKLLLSIALNYVAAIYERNSHCKRILFRVVCNI